MHLLNGETIDRKVRDGKTLAQIVDAKKPPAEMLETLYVMCLARKPTAEEQQKLAPLISADPDPKLALQDIFWSLINSREFLFNH